MTTQETKLRRSISLPLLVLYGLGVTVGAGIYVLIGAAAAEAGIYAPTSFLIAAIVMAFSALSYSEIATRYPVSAGEAAYVREGFRSNVLSTITGALVMASGVISSAAIAIGSAGYVREFLSWPVSVLVVCIVALVVLVAIWGILESVVLAAIFTLVEVGGLLFIIFAGFFGMPDLISRLPEIIPSSGDVALWSGVFSAGLLAFFAFIGFEDLVNIAEEIHNPGRNLPRAIIATLVVTTVIYFLVAAVAVLSTPIEELSTSQAPLSDVFQRVTSISPATITLIAIFATANTLLIQVIMVSRVIYGMAKLGSLPHLLATVNATTQTPVLATVLVGCIVLALALFFPLEGLVRSTSLVALTVFALVNLSLLRIKWGARNSDLAPPPFEVPMWVPVAGFLTCCAFMLSELIALLY